MALSVQVVSAQQSMAKPVDIFTVLTSLFWLAVILIAVYFVTKFIASKSLGLAKPSGNQKSGGFFSFGTAHPHIKIIDKINLNKESALIVVVYQGKQYFLAASQNDITVIKESDYKEPEHTASQYQMPDNFITRFINKQNKTNNINKTDSFEEILKNTKENEKGEDGE